LERGSVSTYLKLELLSPLDVGRGEIEASARFHLFEAGAFVTADSLPRSILRSGCVSTYLKLELLSQRIPGAEHSRRHRVSTYLKLELLSLLGMGKKFREGAAFPPI